LAGIRNTTERFKRLALIKDLREEGKTVTEIAEETDIPEITVKRNLKYIKDLSVADLTLEEIGGKREELYFELLEATAEAKSLFQKCRDDDRFLDAKRFYSAWLEAVKARANLYGLDNMRIDNLIQINQNNLSINSDIIDKVDSKTAEILSKKIIENHENRVRE
jgi:hypothetical protein